MSTKSPHEVEKIKGLLKKWDATAKLSAHNLSILAQHATVQELKRSQRIWRKHDLADHFFIVANGLVEISDISDTGEERILALLGPGEVIGLSAALRRDTFPAHAFAASKLTRVISLSGLSVNVERPPLDQRTWDRWIIDTLLNHERHLRDKIALLSAGRLHDRLTYLFEILRIRHAQDQNNETFSIPLPINKTQIAKLVDARVETVIRTLNQWERSGHLMINESGLSLRSFHKLREKKKIGDTSIKPNRLINRR